jgi:hypothetical protein
LASWEWVIFEAAILQKYNLQEGPEIVSQRGSMLEDSGKVEFFGKGCVY